MALPYRGDERALCQRLESVEAQLLEHDRSAEIGQPAPSGNRVGLEAERGQPAPSGDRAGLEAGGVEPRERLEAERVELLERLAVFGDRFSPNDLRRASPCGADWGAMAGDERVRFCSKCQKNVYNLSGLRHAEAEAIVQNAEGEHYERLRQRADGTVLSGDCPEGSAEKFKRRLPLIAGSGALVAASAVASFSFALAESAPLTNPEPAFAIDTVENFDPRVFAKYYGPFEFPPERAGTPPYRTRPPKVVRVGPLPPKHVAQPGPSAPQRSR
ncbi:MAG: hypothetical protein MUF34_19865 [Polyangiaceae bacterium]|jgi:hypothetical protein|nr:hypothetical protein [Polyangiaceae bacterium]